MDRRAIATDTLRFDLPAFETLIDTLARGQTAIVNHLMVLDKRIHVLRTGWTGTARDAYLAAQAQRVRSLAGLIATLTAATQFVQTARDGYEQAENQIREAWPA